MGHSLGWVQDASSFNNLKSIVGLLQFDSKFNKHIKDYKLPLLLHNSKISKDNYDTFLKYLNEKDIKIPYSLLKGKGSKSGESRGDALCTGIAQAAIDGQKTIKYKSLSGDFIELKKLYSGDWQTECFLRWAISIGFVNCDDNDFCTITEIGKKFIDTEDDSKEEKDILRQVFLSYPPMCRILELLSSGSALSKFDIGNKLGFKGEQGFTSMDIGYWLMMCNVDKNNASNLEGDSDKYARQIASWAKKVGWIETINKEIKKTYMGITYKRKVQCYKITPLGISDFRKTKSNSSKKAIPKYVFYEMLATKGNVDYLRYRRANIINFISKTDRTLESVQRHLKTLKLEETTITILDEIENLKNIGLNIKETINAGITKYKITDTIEKLEIPKISVKKDNVIELKDRLRSNLKNISHDYLELVDLAYSEEVSKSAKNADAREFEIKTANLLTKELDFKGMRLGDSNKPDVIISYGQYGTIIDTKSYKDGFSVDKSCADEMARYIIHNNNRKANVPTNEWWKNFDDEANTFSFLFVTSFLTGKFEDNLKEIAANTSTNGGAINIENLLKISDNLKGKTMEYENFFKLFNNKEIIAA